MLSQEFQAKFSHQALSQNMIKVSDIEVPSKLPNGTVIPRKEIVNVAKVDNLIVMNAYPVLSANK